MRAIKQTRAPPPPPQGTFGKVVRAEDFQRKKDVAIKVVRAIPKYRSAAMTEIDVLEVCVCEQTSCGRRRVLTPTATAQTIAKFDPEDLSGCIRLLSSFDWRGHVCMTFDLYGLSLFEFIKVRTALSACERPERATAEERLQAVFAGRSALLRSPAAQLGRLYVVCARSACVRAQYYSSFAQFCTI